MTDLTRLTPQQIQDRIEEFRLIPLSRPRRKLAIGIELSAIRDDLGVSRLPKGYDRITESPSEELENFWLDLLAAYEDATEALAEVGGDKMRYHAAKMIFDAEDVRT